MARLIALVCALALGLLAAWGSARTPSPARADAPPARFSAGRAIVDVEALAARPHPVGSPENRAVRDLLVRRMAALGLSPQVRVDRGLFQPHGAVGAISGGRVENIVGVLPGRDRAAPGVMLLAHYDSAANSPGAGDDAAGVAAILETVRAIRTEGAPARDLIVVITDGEEAGLLGAEAFFNRDPLAARVGFVINLEARGGGGRAQMFQTGRDPAGSVRLFQKAARDPQGNSLLAFVYSQMPNDTDFTVAQQAGKAGLNFAFLGRQFDYHAPTATPANLDRGSLQDIGEKTLASAKAALTSSPAADARKLVYSQALGGLMIAYPQEIGWVLLAVVAGLLFVAWRRALKTGPVSWTGVARGFGAFFYLLLGSAALLRLARLVSGAGEDFIGQRWLLAQPLRWEITLGLLATGFILATAAGAARGRRAHMALFPAAIAVAACIFAGGFDPVGAVAGLAAAVVGALAFGKATDRGAAWLGVLKAGALVTLLLQIFAPEPAFLSGWPLLLGALAAAATALGRRRGLALMVLTAAATVGWMGVYAHLMFLGLDRPELLAIMAALIAPVIWPLAQPGEGAPPARLLGPLLIGAGLVLLAFVRLDPPWSARHPQTSFVQRHVDQDAGRAVIAAAPRQGPWSKTALGPAAAPYDHWQFRAGTTAVPTTVPAVAAPEIALTPGADGLVRLRIAQIAGARVLRLSLNPDTPLRAVAIGGAPTDFAMKPGDWSQIRWEGDAEPLEIVLKPGGPGKLELRYGATVEGWPADAPPLPRRPADVAPFSWSDSSIFTGSRRLAW